MTDEELAAIKARCKAATPEPWDWRWKHSELRTLADRGEYVYGSVILKAAEDDGDAGITGGDSDFIAHARTDVPALVAEVDKLRQINSNLHAAWLEDRRALAAAQKLLIEHGLQLYTVNIPKILGEDA